MIYRKEQKPGGSPVWMTTFADLMALMLTFFVLLFSFSVIDAKKYKMIVESMAHGFGAQWIKRETQNPGDTGPHPGILPPLVPDRKPASRINDEEKNLLEELKLIMNKELSDRSIDIKAHQNRITIVFPEKITFAAGSAILHEHAYQPIARLAKVLGKTSGTLEIIGHTDNVPIKTEEFRSNWELSSARAVSVLHAISSFNHIERSRFKVSGLADTQPLVPNTSAANRARNRRVEVILTRQTAR